MTHKAAIAFVAVGLLCIAYAAGRFVAARESAQKEERLIAVSWGGGRFGPAFYGAYVLAVPARYGYSVRAHVKIGRDSGMIHDCGEIARTQTLDEAVVRFGHAVWRDDGLHLGDYFLPRATVESYR